MGAWTWARRLGEAHHQWTEAEDYPALLIARDGAAWLAWQSYSEDGDQIFVRRRTGTEWSAPEAIADPGGDYFRTQLAQDRRGRIWAIWAAQVKENVDLYARRYDGRNWSRIERLTDAPGPDLYHSLAADSAGNLLLAWQSARAGNFDIYLRRFDGNAWSKDILVSGDPANEWEPFVATGPKGEVTILWDTYAKGTTMSWPGSSTRQPRGRPSPSPPQAPSSRAISGRCSISRAWSSTLMAIPGSSSATA